MKRRGPGPHPQTQLHISWTFKDKVNPMYPNSLWIPQPELRKRILPRGGRTPRMSWWVPSPASAFHSIRFPQHLDAFPKAPHPGPGAWGRGRRKQAREVNHLVLPLLPPSSTHLHVLPVTRRGPWVSNGECSGEALRRSNFLHSHFSSHWAQLHTRENPRG